MHEAARTRSAVRRWRLMQSIYNRVIVVAMRWKTVAVRSRRRRRGGGRVRAPSRSGTVLPVRRARPVRGRRLASGRLEGGSDRCCGERASKTCCVMRRRCVNYTSFIGSSFPRFYYNVNPQLPDKNYAQLLVSTDVGGSHAETGPGAAPAPGAGGAGSPRLPERVAAGAGPVGAHRSPAYRRGRARLAVLGRSGDASCCSARQVRWTSTATGARMRTG